MGNGNKCPICGSGVHSRRIDTTPVSHDVTAFASTFGGKVAGKVAGGVVGGFLGAFVGMPTLGAQLGGMAASALAGKSIKSHFDNHRTYTTTCSCQDCGLEWNACYSDNEIVNTIIERKLNDEKGRIGAIFSELFLGLFCFVLAIGIPVGLTWLCWNYCETHESKTTEMVEQWLVGLREVTHYHLSWYFVAGLKYIFGLTSIAAFGFMLAWWFNGTDSIIGNIGYYIRAHKKALKVRKMSLEEYVRNYVESINQDFAVPK